MASARAYSPRMALFDPIFEALDRAHVRYVVVGGVAVVLHGHARLTADLDLAVDLAAEPARRVIEALTNIGLKPAAPVDPLGFADTETRTGWIAERAMRVFTMRDPDDPLRQVDLFVEEPIPFEELWARSEPVALGGLTVRIASIPDLVQTKHLAGRPLDTEDIARLEEIRELRERGMAERTASGSTPTDDAGERQRRPRLEEVLLLTSPAQRFAWLEEAIAFARRAGALPAASGRSSP